MLSGSVNKNDKTVAQVSNGKLRGDQISFTAGGVQYSGRVTGDTIKGTMKSGTSTSDFTATRVGS